MSNVSALNHSNFSHILTWNIIVLTLLMLSSTDLPSALSGFVSVDLFVLIMGSNFPASFHTQSFFIDCQTLQF